METDAIFSRLPEALLDWYELNKRDLPWRNTRDPYAIWLSEIMLQQTRVEAVKKYYARFLSALPTVEALANADGEYLRKLWEGLGYYSRVRNMQKAAVVIREKFNGVFPKDYDTVLSLPGIGRYTAGAICSIAFGAKTPAVDGNVLRVVSRLTNDPTPTDLPAYRAQTENALAQIYPDRAGAFTQALMELGATVCGPNHTPMCDQCPCAGFCAGAAAGTAQALPVRRPKREKRTEEMTVFILHCAGRYALKKRADSGLLASMWEFPNVPRKLNINAAIGTVEGMGAKPLEIIKTVERKHIFTHVIWHMRGVYMETGEMCDALQWFTPEQIRREIALPTAFRLFWEEAEI